MKVVNTVGYEGMEIEGFVTMLKAAAVTVLADVRALALSRKKGFSKNGLRDRLEAEGIAYLHLVELGDPKIGRDAAHAGRVAEFKRIYLAHLETAGAISALEVLDELARRDTVCLLCFERDPTVCHRTLIADRLKARGFKIFDLYGDEPDRNVHAKKVPRRHHSQGDAKSQPEAR